MNRYCGGSEKTDGYWVTCRRTFVFRWETVLDGCGDVPQRTTGIGSDILVVVSIQKEQGQASDINNRRSPEVLE